MSAGASAGEGAIQFTYELAPQVPDAPERLAGLDAWRRVAQRLGACGQDPQRYDGLAFGNLSARHPEAAGFLITASQTAALPRLAPGDLVHIRRWDLDTHHVTGTGVRAPSSETLTHAAVYTANPDVHWVVHGHLPEIWQARAALALPSTPEDAANGTPALSHALAAQAAACEGPTLIALGGHRDGVLAFASAPEAAFTVLVAALAEALTHHPGAEP